MDKSGRYYNQGKIIPFPNLEKRLLEKGLDHLQQKKFLEAIRFFEEALELDSANGDVYIGLVLANFEAGLLQEAKDLAEEMLRKGIGDYLQIVDLYLLILVQLSEYEEIVTAIEGLLEEREIPSEKLERFSRMLHFSRRMAEGKGDQLTEEALSNEFSEKSLNLFVYQDPKDQLLLAAKLSTQNIRPYMEEIKAYLTARNGHPFLKTILLNILKEQEYEKPLQVEKLGWSQTVVPIDLPVIQSQERLKTITGILGSHLEHEDPILFENIKSLAERHFFLLYPFEPDPADPHIWAAAYHAVANEYHGIETSLKHTAASYDVSPEKVQEAVSFIRQLEEISSPNI